MKHIDKCKEFVGKLLELQRIGFPTGNDILALVEVLYEDAYIEGDKERKGQAAIYTKGKADGRREAMSDIRELLGKSKISFS